MSLMKKSLPLELIGLCPAWVHWLILATLILGAINGVHDLVVLLGRLW